MGKGKEEEQRRRDRERDCVLMFIVISFLITEMPMQVSLCDGWKPIHTMWVLYKQWNFDQFIHKFRLYTTWNHQQKDTFQTTCEAVSIKVTFPGWPMRCDPLISSLAWWRFNRLESNGILFSLKKLGILIHAVTLVTPMDTKLTGNKPATERQISHWFH